MRRAEGALLSPYDSRDYKLDYLIFGDVQIPKSFRRDDDTFRRALGVKDQGSISSCVAHALATCREIVEYEQSKTIEQFSVGFIHGNRTEGDNKGKGMYIREALRGLLRDGVCPNKYLPENKEYPEIQSYFTGDVFVKAKPHKISGYARLYSVAEIQQALIQLGPVAFRMDTFEYPQIPMSNNVLVKPAAGAKKSDSGHAMVILGWTADNKFIVQNSWGKDWGDKGYFYIPFDLIGYDAFRFEFWATVDGIIPNRQKFIDKADDGEPLVKMWHEMSGGYKSYEPKYKTEYKWVRISQVKNHIQNGFHLCREVTIADIRTFARMRVSVDKYLNKAVLFEEIKPNGAGTGKVKWLHYKYREWDLQIPDFGRVKYCPVNEGKDIYDLDNLCEAIVMDWLLLKNRPV